MRELQQFHAILNNRPTRGVLITGSTGKKKVDNKEIVDIATGLIAELQECKDGLKNKES